MEGHSKNSITIESNEGSHENLNFNMLWRGILSDQAFSVASCKNQSKKHKTKKFNFWNERSETPNHIVLLQYAIKSGLEETCSEKLEKIETERLMEGESLAECHHHVNYVRELFHVLTRLAREQAIKQVEKILEKELKAFNFDE